MLESCCNFSVNVSIWRIFDILIADFNFFSLWAEENLSHFFEVWDRYQYGSDRIDNVVCTAWSSYLIPQLSV